MESQGVVDFLIDRLHLDIPSPRPNKLMHRWRDLARRVDTLRKEVNITLVGKYTKLEDSYASVSKSLQHAALAAGYKLNINYIEACHLERQTKQETPALYHEAWQTLCKSE
jgi:CTP synthase